MAETATIFIPDISGYTDFISKTEIDHNSLVIRTLITTIIEANSINLTVSEVEGDAVLFYRKGPPVPMDQMIDQVLMMYRGFHQALDMLNRTKLCPCAACKSLSMLTLKFIAHYGMIQEISYSNFNKASGKDMIIAHRLMKNRLPTHEYVLISRDYLDAAGSPRHDELQWHSAEEEYPGIGNVSFEYSTLEKIKESIPELPPLELPPATEFGDAVETEIETPFLFAYCTIIDIGNRAQWMHGVTAVDGDPVAHIGSKHSCISNEFRVDVYPVKAETSDDEALFLERREFPGSGLRLLFESRFRKISEDRTLARMRILQLNDAPLPADFAGAALASMKSSLANLKAMCEQGGREIAA